MKNGLYCSAGYDWFSIGSEGRVSTCNAHIYRTDNGIYLGNILTDDIKLRTENDWFKCPSQGCIQVCDRHWARKQIYKDDIIIDEQDIVNPSVRIGKERFVSILFAPTWKCNYSCKYCCLPTKEAYPTLSNVCDIHSASEWISAFDRFFTTNKIDGGLWHTNGGEPLYYKDINILFNYFFGKKFKIALTTNLSSNIYKNIVRSVPPEAFGIINCSLHPSDKNFKWELFKNGVQLLKSLNYPVAINFVGHPDQLMIAPDYAEWCKSINVNFSLIPIVGETDECNFRTIEDYPEPMRNIINNFSSSELKDQNKFINANRVSK